MFLAHRMTFLPPRALLSELHACAVRASPGLASPPLPRRPPDLRAHSTRPGASTRYNSPMEDVLLNRSQLRAQLPMELVRVTGVSFEGRQAAVAQLHAGQGLAFVREPDNVYDPHAVAVRTLDDVPLGYVPRDRTASFVHRICFGRVRSAGATDKGLYGCSAEVQPGLPPLVVLPIPASLRGRTGLAAALEGAEGWARVKAAALATSNGRCAISAAPTASVAERWEFNDAEGVMKLVSLAPQAPEVTRVQHMLETGEDWGEVLQAMNGWSSDDCAAYLGGAAALCEARSSGQQEWKMDLVVARTLGLEIPDTFADIVAA